MKTVSRPIISELRKLIHLLEEQQLENLSQKDLQQLDTLLLEDIPRLLKLLNNKEH